MLVKESSVLLKLLDRQFKMTMAAVRLELLSSEACDFLVALIRVAEGELTSEQKIKRIIAELLTSVAGENGARTVLLQMLCKLSGRHEFFLARTRHLERLAI